ncbi:MAG: protein YgfX [Gammaproteobacteria bacterium]
MQRSKRFTALILVVLIGSLIIIASIALNAWIKFVLLILVVVYGGYTIWRHALLKHPDSITKLICDDHEWYASDSKKVFSINILGDSVITSVLCFLRFTMDDSRRVRTLVVFNDMVDKESFRRLKVVLRCS